MSLASLIAGCSEEGPTTPTPVEVTEIVTVAAQQPATMTLLRPGRTPVELVASESAFSEKIEVGRRIVVRYAAQDTTLRPIPVTLLGAATIPFDTIRTVGHSEFEAMAPAGVEILSQWQTGDYVNVQALYNYNGTPRSLTVVADESTLHDATVNCRFYSPDDLTDNPGVQARSYGSFFIGSASPGKNVKILK